jgi:hypothetical protein
MRHKPRRVVDEDFVFALGPLAKETRWREDIFDAAIQPAVTELGMKSEHALLSVGFREAMKDVWHNIWRAKLVIADITADNPNVNHELGICHCIGVPVIIVANFSRKEKIPFDYGHLHVHWFDSADDLKIIVKSAILMLQHDPSAAEPIWDWPDTWRPQRESLWRTDNPTLISLFATLS